LPVLGFLHTLPSMLTYALFTLAAAGLAGPGCALLAPAGRLQARTGASGHCAARQRRGDDGADADPRVLRGAGPHPDG